VATTVTTKGQVTIPKSVRDALGVHPGCSVEFDVNDSGEIVLRKVVTSRATRTRKRDRFDAVRDSATVKWRTDELMKLLRG
jgi:antitoxin PrlF